ncbi:hypothetical protein Hanom_Chr08g00742921 [Helianthus anomalus]
MKIKCERGCDEHEVASRTGFFVGVSGIGLVRVELGILGVEKWN